MKKLFYTSLIIIALLLVTCSGEREKYENLHSLIEAERTFARMSLEIGMQEAFLAHLSDSSMVLRPQPMNGRLAYEKAQNIPGMLVWQPEYADISAAGELGFTTGPWEFRRNGLKDSVSVYGHYITIWQKNRLNAWKVVFDAGVPHSSPTYSLLDTILNTQYPQNFLKGKNRIDLESERNKLIQVEKSFSSLSEEEGYRQAFKAFAAEDVRIYRSHKFPQQVFSNITEVFPEAKDPFSWSVMDAKMAISGDLAYTFGVANSVQKIGEKTKYTKYSYLRIWKKPGGHIWKIAVDLMLPLLK